MTFDDNMISFKKGVRFMRRKMEFILIGIDDDNGLFCHFFPVLEVNVIGECEFSKTHKGKKTSEEQSTKEKVVMFIIVNEVKNNFGKVGDGESSFSFCCCAMKMKTTLHSSFD